MYQIITLYTLNLHSVIHHLYLHKVGKKKRNRILVWFGQSIKVERDLKWEQDGKLELGSPLEETLDEDRMELVINLHKLIYHLKSWLSERTQIWVQTHTHASSCMTLGRLPNLSDLFSFLYGANNSICFLHGRVVCEGRVTYNNHTIKSIYYYYNTTYTSCGGWCSHLYWRVHPRDNCAQKCGYLKWNKCRRQELGFLYCFKQSHSPLTSVHLLTFLVYIDTFCCPGSWGHPWLKPLPNSWLPKPCKALFPAGPAFQVLFWL